MSELRYEVREVDVLPRLVAGVRAQVPFGGVAQAFGWYLDQVYAVGHDGAVTLDGQNVFIYRSKTDGVLDVEFCVGATAPFATVGNVEPLQTPSGRAAMTTHQGDYGGLYAANVAIKEWMAAKGMTAAGPSWEVYGHWNPDPSLLTTDVYWLVAP